MSDGKLIETRDAVKAEYDAEFDEDAPTALAKVDVAETISLLGPSPRSQIRAIQVELARKMREQQQEVREMMEREVALKDANRKLQEHNRKLADERDYWKDLKDPDALLRQTRDELTQTRTLLDDAVQKKSKQEINEVLARQRSEGVHFHADGDDVKIIFDEPATVSDVPVRLRAESPWWKFWRQ